MHQFMYKPWHLYVTVDPEDPAKLRAEGNTFIVSGVNRNNLEPMIMPMFGYIGTTQFSVRTGEERAYSMPTSHPLYKKAKQEDERISSELHRLTLSNNSWTIFKTESHPAMDNWYANLARLAADNKRVRSMDDLKDFLKGQDVIFCGAGPSFNEIEEDLIELMRYDDRPVIIAGGSAIRVFHDAGIDPDICIAIDPYDNQYDSIFSKLEDDWVARQRWVIGMHLNHKCFRAISILADNIYLNPVTKTLDIFKDIMKGRTQCREGGTGVSTFMLEIAKMCEIHQLQLVGIDLCFKGDIAYADCVNCSVYNEQAIIVNNKKTRQVWLNEKYHLESVINRDLKGCVCQISSQHTLKLEGVRQSKKLLEPRINLPEEAEPVEFVSSDMVDTIDKLIEDTEISCDNEDVADQHPLFTTLLLPYYNYMKALQLRGGNQDKDMLNKVLKHNRKKLKSCWYELTRLTKDDTIRT